MEHDIDLNIDNSADINILLWGLVRDNFKNNLNLKKIIMLFCQDQ